MCCVARSALSLHCRGVGEGVGGGGLACPLATDTCSHTAGGASCGSPKVFVLCVCGTEIDRRGIASERSLQSHHT